MSAHDQQDTLAKAFEAARAACDTDAAEREKAEALREFGPDGRWRFAPESEKRAAVETVEGEQRARRSAALRALAEELDAEQSASDALLADLRSAPTALRAFERRYRSYAPADEVALGTLQELVVARLERERLTATPADVARQYASALAGHRTADTVTVWWVEHVHGDGWRGAAVEGPEQAAGVAGLRRAIEAARKARVPEALTARRGELGRVRTWLSRTSAALRQAR
jgi:hypothetical protein